MSSQEKEEHKQKISSDKPNSNKIESRKNYDLPTENLHIYWRGWHETSTPKLQDTIQ